LHLTVSYSSPQYAFSEHVAAAWVRVRVRVRVRVGVRRVKRCTEKKMIIRSLHKKESMIDDR